MCDDMFSEDPKTRERARKCMIAYWSKIRTTSYPDLDLIHTTLDESNEICPRKIIPVNNQEIRNLRDKTISFLLIILRAST